MALKSLNSHLPENWLPDEASPHVDNGRFENLKPVGAVHWTRQFRLLSRFLFERNERAEPDRPIPVRAVTREQLLALPSDRIAVVRLGHSSLLLKIDGGFWLIDPVFSERASPYPFAGPRRFHQPPIAIEDLPAIRGVVISHNHYDHLDKAAIRQLHPQVRHFYVPLGVGGDLARWGVPLDKITEFDWWQAKRVGTVTLVAMPAQHFSGRGPGDGNKTLWCSWALRTNDTRIFYSGDSGYFGEFKRIGEEYGPFDLTLLETGAYDEMWPDVHMQPEETLQAHLDLRGRQLMPVHNGTFRLAFHPWDEPLERIRNLSRQSGVSLLTPEIGQVVPVGDSNETTAWWHQQVAKGTSR